MTMGRKIKCEDGSAVLFFEDIFKDSSRTRETAGPLCFVYIERFDLDFSRYAIASISVRADDWRIP